MAFLFTHGLLHLLGYDHMNKEDEEKMFNLQDYVLDKLNIKREA
jgi:probable rRNA maturation factor